MALRETAKLNRGVHNRRRPWWSHIEPKLMLGALPLRNKNHLDQLVLDEGVQAIVTMNQPTELLPNLISTPISPAEWKNAQVAQCFGSTKDFSPPTMDTIERCASFIHKHVDIQQQKTYVHCKAGRGRSTVVVVAFLMQYRNMRLEEAIAFVKSKRPHVRLHPKQLAILQKVSEKSSASILSQK